MVDVPSGQLTGRICVLQAKVKTFSLPKTAPEVDSPAGEASGPLALHLQGQ